MRVHASPHAYAALRAEAVRPRSAAALRAASALLARLARRMEARAYEASRAEVQARVQAAAPAPRVEFHAEAGALEGALYLDGRLVGYLPVSRL